MRIKNTSTLELVSFSFFNLDEIDKNGNFVISHKFNKKNKNFNSWSNDIRNKTINNFVDFLKIDQKDLIIDETKERITISFVIEKNINLRICSNIDDFYNELYKIIISRKMNYNQFDFDSIIVSSCFAPRGSYDSKLNFFSVDIKRKNSTKNFYKKFLNILFLTTNLEQLNFNPRENQPQFKNENIKRNNQIRINASFFYNKFKNTIFKISYFKYCVLKNDETKLLSKNYRKINDYENIMKIIYIYINEVIDNEEILKEYVQMKNFNNFKDVNKRDFVLRKIADESLENKCYGCYGIYNLEDRTFLRRKKEWENESKIKWYLEIHHVISFSNGDVDVIENLVKLCPVCHKTLIPFAAEKIVQKQIIHNIFNNSPDAYDYVKNISSLNELDDLIEFVYKNLK